MNILCVDQDRTKLNQLKRDVKELVPGAHITLCHDPFKAEAIARTKGCDVLLTEAIFDRISLDGVMVAQQIQALNPHVNIIFVTDHADTSAAYSAWELGASAFLLRPYDKERLAKALTEPRFAAVWARDAGAEA